MVGAALPVGAAGAWCLVRVERAGAGDWWARIELTDAARGQVVRAVFAGALRGSAGRGWRAALVHVPAAAEALRVRVFADEAGGCAVAVRVLPRWVAAVRLLWFGRGQVVRALAGGAGGRMGRLRALLGQAPARAGVVPPYARWLAWYEETPPPAPGFDAQLVVVGDGTPAALAATLGSIEAQRGGAGWPVLRVETPADWHAVAAPWVIILQVGDILAPHALAWFAHARAAMPQALGFLADCDRMDADGGRCDPLFKPVADPLFMRSGLAFCGAAAFAWPMVAPALPVQAWRARQILAEGVWAHVAHVPRIASHVAEIAARVGEPIARADGFAPHVSMIVPTAARSPHVRRCVEQVLQCTNYADFSLTLTLAAPARADAAMLARLAALPKLEILELDIAPFNYAAVNNAAARVVPGELLLLLNDDVAPMDPGWLDAMVAQMQEPGVGAVGARLLYGNGMVQHEGVIMGLADMCEHAGRLRAGDDAGVHGMGVMPRAVSAVTAACLLIRAELYQRVGGMDAGFAVALNDVDLCLRVRQAGFRIVYCPGATLHHYESLSLGRHYAGARAGLESLEVRRLRGRWADVIADDPYYNPQAALEPGREWRPAFPPRARAAARMVEKPAADH